MSSITSEVKKILATSPAAFVVRAIERDLDEAQAELIGWQASNDTSADSSAAKDSEIGRLRKELAELKARAPSGQEASAERAQPSNGAIKNPVTGEPMLVGR
jgi:hypothetical protein